MIIRRAMPSDAADVRAIYAPYVEHSSVTFETDLPTTHEIEKRIELINQEHLWLIAEMDGMCIGYAYASSHRSREAYASVVETSIYMKASRQGQGLGTRLFSVLLENTGLMGYHAALSIITLPNETSEIIHQRLGFTHLADFKNIGFK